MSPSVTCYPIPGKAKASLTCEAFAEGVIAAGGRAHVCTRPPAELGPGAAVFYGVRPAVEHLWRQARKQGRDWYYIDNAYFDLTRERYFRVTKNALQATGLGAVPIGERDAAGGISFTPRWRELGVKLMPWRTTGRHIVVCAQSEEYMRVVAGWRGDWLMDVLGDLRKLTQRHLVVRRKGDKRPLAEDLRDAWALVTHSSAAAVEAALAGVPVFVTGQCATSAVAMNPGVASFARIEERPAGFDLRPQWADNLARSQWTIEEISRGDAWRAMNGD